MSRHFPVRPLRPALVAAVLFVFAVSACRKSRPPAPPPDVLAIVEPAQPPAPAAVQPAPAPETDASAPDDGGSPTAPAARAAASLSLEDRARDRLLGVWVVQFEGVQARQVRIIRAALRNPPLNATEVASLALTREEQGFFQVVQTAMRSGDSRLELYRQMVDAVERSRLEFSQNTVELVIGPERLRRPFRVVGATPDAVEIEMAAVREHPVERSMIRFAPNDTLIVSGIGQRESVRFVRQRP